jgi:hypothetical protein
MKKNTSIERHEGYHCFQGKLIKAIKKQDSRTFGIALQNSNKYRSYSIKKKRLCK